MIELLDFPIFAPQLDLTDPETMVVNARLIPSVSNFELVKQMLSSSGGRDARVSSILRDGNTIAAAVFPTQQIEELPDGDRLRLIESVGNDPNHWQDTTARLFNYPHDVIQANMDCFDENIQHRIASGDYRESSDGVFVGSAAVIGDHVVTDTRVGPIIIDQDASVGPFSFLRGPIYIGPKSRINEHAAIKDAVSLAHTTKIGGEVEGAIIEAYSNKQHHGFLGHSYLGSWINLGAGTCNSDLKNTYGMVNVVYGGDKVSTGMQFVGCVMGDFVKTAINTSIFTGKIIGACSMLYGFVTTNVPSFVNYARSLGQTSELPVAIMISTQQRMFARRTVQQRPSDIQLLQDMYELTRHERQLSDEPLML
jgi:glucose-1-phosphate thymidylyltransferase